LAATTGKSDASFRLVVAAAGLDPTAWSPRELRHSFVSLLSEAGVPAEDVSRLVGHRSSTVTETVYREQLRRPVITEGICRLTCGFLCVGDTGIEPVTSSVSGKRATAAPIALCFVSRFEVEKGFEPS
jgi:Phage integrase family